MSAGRATEGAGCVTWWGFSPARDLLRSGPESPEGEINMLLVGSADPRHILKTIAGLRDEDTLNVWLVESSMEVVARQMLLLYLALIPLENMGLNEKAEFFLEVFGNCEIRSATEETLKRMASELMLGVTSTLDTPAHPCMNTTLLKCGTINRQQYAQWRERGLAFELREGIYRTNNPSMISSRIFQKGGKIAVSGYWGDIVTGPYLCYGVETDDKSMLETRNGIHMKTAQDISFANVQKLFQSLTSRHCSGSCTAPASTENSQPSVSVGDLMHLKHITIKFLPLDSLEKLPEKQKYRDFFNVIFFSASSVAHLGSPMRQIAAPDAVLVVELAKYVLDLSKEQEAGFKEKVQGISVEAGFEPCHQQALADDALSVFIAKKE
ncbi:dynein axonemal assembly factor 3-like isoform X3 [Synchiropus splendidus]|uniref:dynein axonemal assembly factor 3-like isoform X3 n=1 Tax=Synchiropus splendidus TaxID=270530 RepID=UPI00237E891D|nr:dynein axonemal assembly factor 3-like isoform X3 [Synchiropus splendidus]